MVDGVWASVWRSVERGALALQVSRLASSVQRELKVRLLLDGWMEMEKVANGKEQT